MLYGPITEKSLTAHYSQVKQRLGLTRRRQVSATKVPGVHYEHRATNHREREFMVINVRAAQVPGLMDIDDQSFVPKWRQICAEVADSAGISLAALYARGRKPAVVRARQEACYRVYHETTMSMDQIAVKFGYCDHSVVHHCIKRHQERLEAAAQ